MPFLRLWIVYNNGLRATVEDFDLSQRHEAIKKLKQAKLDTTASVNLHEVYGE